MDAVFSSPLVSLGMPAYNGEAYVREAMHALVSQDYSPLEIVVSDNASTDRTWEILQEFEGDPRVILNRSDHNIGAVGNFNRVFQLTRGEYFAWAAVDDRFEPSFARRCVEILQQDHQAAGCLIGIRFVDETGATTRTWVPGAEAASHNLSTRLRWYLALGRWTESYALFRRPVLEAAGLFPEAYGPDVLLVWRILLKHRMAIVEDLLFTYREKVSSNDPEQVYASLSEAGREQPARFLNLGILRSMWAIAGEAPPGTRRVARHEIIRCMGNPAWRGRAARDLLVELRRNRAAAAQVGAPSRQVLQAKARAAGIHLLLATMEPTVYIRAGIRHAVARVRRPAS